MSNTTSFEVAFGISGSISAYKSLDVIRHLRKQNISITPIFSSSAKQFVTPWSVETLAERPLIESDVRSGKITHLDLIKSANLLVICPASANMIAKLATGHCNDLLSAAFLSFTGPKLLFPAMHTEMYENPITQANIRTLRNDGIVIIPPDEGELACGDTGLGRLPDPSVISQVISAHLLPETMLKGKSITITCGGTQEPIDSVRHISNNGSGTSGHALANIAASYGADVTLIRTKQHPTLSTIKCVDVSSASEMKTAVFAQKEHCDVLIMNAAVSDFTTTPQDKKQSRGTPITLSLNPTDDILRQFNKESKTTCKSIGYCLSDHDNLIDIAKQKMVAKGCDVIIANAPDNIGQPNRTFHIIQNDQIITHQNLSIVETAVEILKTI